MKTLIGDLDALYQYTAGLAREPFTCGNRERMFIARRPVTDMARGRLGAPIAALAWVLARELPGLRMVLRPELGLTPLLAKQPVLIADFTAQLASSELTALARSRRLNGAVYSLPSSAPSPGTRSWKGRLKRPLAAHLMAGPAPGQLAVQWLTRRRHPQHHDHPGVIIADAHEVGLQSPRGAGRAACISVRPDHL
jgi:hypothetical protein